MPSDSAKSTAFIFAHQDDEMGVFTQINTAIENGIRPVAFYMTSGAEDNPHMSERRAQESIIVLKRLGVASKDIHFLGTKLGILDGQLTGHLERAYMGLAIHLEKLSNLDSLYVHAFEGGHPDHDACYMLALQFLKTRDVTAFEFPMYRATLKGPFPYRVAAPLTDRDVLNARVSLGRAFGFTKLCLTYRTQFKAMLGLLPFFMWDWFVRRRIQFMPFYKFDTVPRPHDGHTFYEARGYDMTFEDFRQKSLAFLSADNRES